MVRIFYRLVIFFDFILIKNDQRKSGAIEPFFTFK